MIIKRAPVTIRPVTPQDFDAWKPLWDEYNAFYERVGPTALPDEVTVVDRQAGPAEPRARDAGVEAE